VQYYQPSTLSDAVERLQELDNAEIVAGGQSMMPLLRQELVSPDALVDITQVPDLDTIEISDDTVHIGALTTYSDVLDSDLSERLPMLRDTLNVIGDIAVRNAGTIGGGVAQADQAQDLPPALQCYKATVVSFDGEETRRHDITEFFHDYYVTDLEPHELITGVSFDAPPERSGEAYANDAENPGGWSNAGIAALLDFDEDEQTCVDARLAYCAGAPVPKRVPRAVEELLVGKRIGRQDVDEVAMAIVDDLELIVDVGEDKEYRQHLFRVMTKRAIASALERSPAPKILEAQV
jgi:carbon-monoxide dehydrogenase medium subunit